MSLEVIEAQLTLLHMVALRESALCRPCFALPKPRPFYGDSDWTRSRLGARSHHRMAVTPSKDPLVWIDCEVGQKIQSDIVIFHEAEIRRLR